MAGINGIQRVTLTLARLLADRMERRSDVVFTFGMPKPTPASPRLNIFLYHVKETPYLRNEQDPRKPPAPDGFAPLALELGYLITSYSGGSLTDPGAPSGTPVESLPELDAQEILADAMRVLHDEPIITAKTPKLHGGGVVLDEGLKNEYEPLRITPRQFDIDDITKLWTAFREDYQRSVAYQVSVIRIEPSKPKVTALPVLTPVIAVSPSASAAPSLESLDPLTVLPLETIRLAGEKLNDPTIAVYVSDGVNSGFPVAPELMTINKSPAGLTFQIPNDATKFRPGPKKVEARVSPFTGHELASNQLTLNLAPGVDAISVASGKFDGSVTLDITGKLLGADPAAVGTGSPLVPVVLFGSYVIPKADITFTALPAKLTMKLNAPDPNAANLPKTGQALPVRVVANGVESRTWRPNATTGAPEPNPNLVFTVT